MLFKKIELKNSTHLCEHRLNELFIAGVEGWAFGSIRLFVRYSRGADFSGTFFYTDHRMFINLGKHLTYPYRMKTYIARGCMIGNRWCKPAYTIELDSAYEVVLFVFMHELYHLLVKRAKRNTRQKETMCDRFATRHLVDHFGAKVHTLKGKSVPREAWDLQDVVGFVASTRDLRSKRWQMPERSTIGRSGYEQRLLFG